MALKTPKASLTNPYPRPRKRKAFNPSKRARFVLFIGDEGAILVHVRGNTVLSRQFVPDTTQQNLNEIRTALAEDPKAPLMMVIDTMDQSYVQQTLPPVSAFGVQKLIRRRLDREFGPEDIKGAVLLGREKTGRKDWNFMMISLEKSPQLTAWFDFIAELPNYFEGIYLVAVETELMVKRLEQALGVPKAGTGAEWKFFVSHNKVGGFRQVILHHGRIVFTRLAQPIGESNLEVIAGSIEQEILSTIEYMKRMSFSAQAGLDMYIVASNGLKALIDKSKFNASSLQVFTPYELAGHLGIEGATQPNDQFGDVVLAASIGCSKKHVLTLASQQFVQMKNYHQAMRYQRLAAGVIILGMLGYGASIGLDLYSNSQRSDELNQNRQAVQRELDSLQAEIKQANIDVQGASDLIDLYHQLLGKQLSPLPFIEKLTPITQSPVWIKGIQWTLSDGGAGAKGVVKSDKMVATITLEFPEAANDQKVFRVVAKRVLTDFKDIYKTYDVKYSLLPQGFLENDRLDIDLNSEKQMVDKKTSASPEAQISIEGFADMKKAEATANPSRPSATPKVTP